MEGLMRDHKEYERKPKVRVCVRGRGIAWHREGGRRLTLSHRSHPHMQTRARSGSR